MNKMETIYRIVFDWGWYSIKVNQNFLGVLDYWNDQSKPNLNHDKKNAIKQ